MIETILTNIASMTVLGGLIVALYKIQVKRIDQHDADIKDLYEKHNGNVERIIKVETEFSNHKNHKE